ncbi:hypothetical protein [Bradyrhizobium guangdongense]|uniref:hypothetical protein n=1 Tax=Bradyrhizobium guangdongense TaxID=1325090 RepID=UPI00131A174E|nr:hypothetical protein [Bradyrhizobium guangdongense]
MEQADDRAVVLLTSGHILKIAGITLYPAEILTRAAGLRAQASGKLGGVSTGIGFLGSPGWALGAGAALGLLEGALSDAARREGVALLRQADEADRAALNGGLLFRVSEIVGIERPAPATWAAATRTKRVAPVRHMEKRQKAGFLASHGLSEADVSNGTVALNQITSFAHNGDDFLTVDTDIGLMSIRWSTVASYVAPPPAAPPPLPVTADWHRGT